MEAGDFARVRGNSVLATCGVGADGGALEERGDFFPEYFPGGFSGEENVIGARQRNENCPRNFRRQDAAFFWRCDAVAVRVEDDGWDG